MKSAVPPRAGGLSKVARQRQREAAFGAGTASDALSPVERDAAALADIGQAERQPWPDIDACDTGLYGACRHPAHADAGRTRRRYLAIDRNRTVGKD
ncbi:MAG TPA: hypothetical protein PK217_14825, partial [Sphingopyxis terrae]|nr:hypothetical protein [Sphingopyxis terrae]